MAGGVKFDSGKIRFDLLPPRPMFEIGLVYTIGANKYTDRNWELGMSWGRIFGALLRHAWKWCLFEKYDRECLNKDCRAILSEEAGQDRNMSCSKCGTGGMRFHHLAAVAWCAISLIEYEETHTEQDDRSQNRGEYPW